LHFHSIRPSLFGNTSCPIRARYPAYIPGVLHYLYSGKEKPGEEPELHRKGFDKCRQAALYLKQHLDNLKLQAFLKTSGKTGLHIYVPIERNIDYDTVRSMSEIICAQVLKEHSSEITMDWPVKKLTGKVFLDHNMNARSKSLASIYSPRVAAQGTVSTPIDWQELEHVYPTDFNMRTVPKRLAEKGDLWSGILKAKSNLTTIFDPNNATESNGAG
jgi:bifunctional non-homologous end joining protein LigD